MKLSQYGFEFKPELIAHYPEENRDEARMMVVHRKDGTIEHRIFKDILDYFEENDMFVNVSLPAQGMYVRGKRRMFDERTCPGMAVQVRIGRVHPLYNEIQILEAVSMDG